MNLDPSAGTLEVTTLQSPVSAQNVNFTAANSVIASTEVTTSRNIVDAHTRSMSPEPADLPSHLAVQPSKRRKLLKRSHHTICTFKQKSEKLRNGYKIDYYISYVFGGLIQEDDGRFCPTNDLIEVVTKNVVLDKSQTDVD